MRAVLALGLAVLLLKALLTDVSALSTPKTVAGTSLFRQDGLFARRRMALSASATLEGGPDDWNEESGKLPRAEGPFNPGPEITFGSSGLKMNLFGAIYGIVAISLGIFWWLGLRTLDLVYKLVGNKFDVNRRIPVVISQLWGVVLMTLTGCYPKITGQENVADIFESNKGKKGGDRTPIMLCANHVSWMDIPFVAVAIGWRNYKIIAKQELLKVPILRNSLKTSKHVILDRTNRRSQMETFKKGVKYLKDGVNLVTFPEGTRSRDGKMGSFKLGAFKMAQREGAPIVPLSIRYAHKVQPIEYVWPVRPGRFIGASIHIGKPIYSEGKSDDEVMKEVWDAIAENLPKSQKPEPGTPVSVK